MKATFIYFFLPLFFLPSFSYTQKWLAKQFQLNTYPSTSQPPSNGVFQIRHRDVNEEHILWLGTSKGIASSSDGARTFTHYRSNNAFVKDGIFSLAILGDTIWSSMGYSKDFQDGEVQTGAGYAYSTDNGISWKHKSQTLDGRYDDSIRYGNNVLEILPVVVPEQNVTYDVSIAPNGTVWISSWASGLRRLRSYDDAQWERVLLPPDFLNKLSPDSSYSFYYDPRPYNNIKAFSVFAVNDSVVWCGTAGGINKTTNANDSFPRWIKYSHQNQASPILGNWVIAIDRQYYFSTTDTVDRIWCTNWRAEDFDEDYGVSYTEDDGTTWNNLLHGIKSYDFAFKDSIAYVASDDGLFRTSDGGRTFARTSDIRDHLGNIIATRAFFSVDVINDTLYCGTGDGFVKSIDNAFHPFGHVWEIVRTYEKLGAKNSTYSYPNPFSPQMEITRIHFSTIEKNGDVTIEIFDYGMHRVRTLIRNAPRTSGNEFDEIWNGEDDNKRIVANGVYFYRVIIGDDEPMWGKVLVLQ
jgi:hypothetical protein